MDEAAHLSQELIEAVEASDRAGALVAEHVRAIVRNAEAEAERIRAAAREDATRLVQRALEASGRILAQIDALDGPLSEAVSDLRREADRLSADTGSGSAEHV